MMHDLTRSQRPAQHFLSDHTVLVAPVALPVSLARALAQPGSSVLFPVAVFLRPTGRIALRV